MLPVILFGCRKDNPDPAIESIVGKWQLEAYEKTLNGGKVWETTQGGQPSYLTFRFDGVMLDSKELPMCCPPTGYYLNGTFFAIKPRTSLPHNPQCDLIDCIGCANLDLEQTGDELVITYCAPVSTRVKFVRI